MMKQPGEEYTPAMASKVNHRRIEMIGDLGENAFEHLCILSGFNKTRPGRDSFGWDYFVEIPITSSPFVYADARQGAVTALVQVKATDHFDGAIHTINVKNHEYLAKYNMAAFVFIVDYAGGRNPVNSYLCHYNANRIGATLKRLREIQASGKKNYHKHFMSLKPEPDEIFDLQEDGLLQRRISQIIGDDYARYLQQKDELVKTIGFENGKHTFKFNSSASLDGMTDAMLGLRTIEIEDGLFADLRFGIELGGKKIKSGTLSIEPSNPVDCVIIVREGSSGARHRVRAKAVGAAIPGLEAETFKVRVYGQYFSIILSRDNISVTYQITPDKECNVSSIVEELKFLHACKDPHTTIEVLKDNIFIFSAIIQKGIDGVDDLRYLIYLAEGFETLLLVHSAVDHVRLSLRSIYEQREAVAWSRLISEKRGTNFNGELSDYSLRNMKKQPGIFFLPVVFGSGERQLILFVHWKTSVDVTGREVHARLYQGRIWDKMMTDKDTGNDEIASTWGEFVSFCKVPPDHVSISRSIEFQKQPTIIEGQAAPVSES